MVEDTKRTLAYICPHCRQSVAVERSVFQLAASVRSEERRVGKECM